jgi:crotonobetaine/carnitine-CoA ligase
VSGHAYRGEWVTSRILDDRAERFGDRIAVHTENSALTYAEIRDRAQRVAALLVGLGVSPGDRIATMLDATPHYLSAWFGCAWSGAVEVPVNTEYRGFFLAHLLQESSASVIIIQDRYVDRLRDLATPELKHLVVVGTSPARGVEGKAIHSLADAERLQPLPLVDRREEDLVYVLYTSGTTGASKGVMHCNRSALWTARVWQQLPGLGPDDVGYSYLPLYHVTARSAVVMACLLAGGATVVRERFSLSEFWPDIRRHGVTFTMYMGSVILFLVQQPEQPGERDNPLRVAGGAACPPNVAAEFSRRFDCRLIEVFGMTEVGTVTGPRNGSSTPGTVGAPLSHVTIEIHDARDNPVPAGTVGEIVLRPNEPYAMMQGYWRQPEATVEAWRNLWFHSGDLGLLTEAGELVFVDRLKDCIRRRGENISSFEVERAVQQHPDVQECAAFPVKSEATEDDVMIAVVPKPGATIEAAELLGFCGSTMPRFAVPRFVRIVQALPKTPTGRVQKHLLRSEGVTPDTVERLVHRRV